MTTQPFRILLVEDNLPDVELLKFMFSNCSVPTELSFARDGAEASDYVHRRNAFEGVTPPDLIIMDLNIPKKDGRELVREFKADPDLCQIPIVMVTTSNSDREIHDCYCLGVSAFISKPVDIDQLQSTINKLVDFWSCVQLPTRRPS